MEWGPAPEDSAVVAAREELLETLAELARRIPGDRWILGQRVRYLGDVGRWEEALTLARGCTGGEPWWCPALLGYVHHRAGEGLEAAEAFRAALERMDRRQAARWWDPSILLEYPSAQWIQHPRGVSEGEAVDRFWRLADPLFLTPGNERLTEHFARLVGAELYSDAALTLGLSWGRGLEELLTRYGFTAGWERTWPSMNAISAGTVVEHHHPESRGFLPPLEALEDPGGLLPGVWQPDDDRPRSTSAPVLAPLLVEGRGQIAVLRRDGALLVLAAYGIPLDTLLLFRRGGDGEGTGASGGGFARIPWEPPGARASTDTLAGLFLLADTGSWAPLGAFGTGGSGILQLRAPAGSYIVSLEAWNPSGRWATRVRQGVKAHSVAPDVPTLSDLLLLEAGGAVPQGLAEALPRLRRGTSLQGGEPVTVGWEVYGLGRRREPLTFRVSMLKVEDGLFRKALTRIGLIDRTPPLAVSWSEAGSDSPGPLFRAVDLALPDLDPGPYVLRLELEIPNRSKVFSDRVITLR